MFDKLILKVIATDVNIVGNEYAHHPDHQLENKFHKESDTRQNISKDRFLGYYIQHHMVS